jgi:hypothetical protein
VGELAVDSHINGLEPVASGAPQPRIVPNDRLGVPIEDHHDVEPAHAFNHDFGHIDAPLLIGLGGLWFAVSRRPFGSQVAVGHHQQMVLAHQPQAPLLVHRELLHEAQIGPDATVAPERVLGLERPDTRQQLLIAPGDPLRPLSR